MTTCGRAARARSRSIPVDPGSGNAFVDLALADAGVRTAKAALAVKLNRILKASGLTRASAAKVLGVSQPEISALVNFRLDGISVQRLMNFLTSLGHDIQISIRSRRSARTPGRIVVAGG